MFWCNDCNQKREIVSKTFYGNRSVSLETKCNCSRCYGSVSYDKPNMIKNHLCFSCDNFYQCGQTYGVHKCKRFKKNTAKWSTSHDLKADLLVRNRIRKKNLYLEKMGMETEKYYKFDCVYKERTNCGYQLTVKATNLTEAKQKFNMNKERENLILMSITEEKI